MDKDFAEYLETEDFYYMFYAGMDRVHYYAIMDKASVCPKCGKDCPSPEFEGDDPSVGIFGWGFGNECTTCGVTFWVSDDGVVEWV